MGVCLEVSRQNPPPPPPHEMTTAAVGTHPTGMHSCSPIVPPTYHRFKNDNTTTLLFFFSLGLSCGQPTTNRRIRIMGRSFLYRDRVVYMCPPGQNPTTSPVLTCGQDGKWDKVPGCQGLTLSLYNMIRAWITARVTKVNTFPGVSC